MSNLSQDAEALEIAPGTVIDGRYRVVRAIGQGGNGLVHEVEHLLTGRHLALKSLIDESGLARLEQEARASSMMKNPRTVKITDMGKSGPAGPYLVMELLEGHSLRALLDEAGQLPAELTVNMALQVCECLAEAHALSIIHRDLKPDNIFLCSSAWPGQYDVKVLDFGIVKIAGEGPIPKSSLTRTGSTVGTPYYMSLEQLRNASAVDGRTDIYAMGVVMYECLSGRKPYQADTLGDLVYVICSGPPTHLSRLRPDLPVELCEVVMRMLRANRDDRPASMIEVATALLPHGNSAFGLWLKGDKPSSPGGRAPEAGTPTPPGLRPPVEPMPKRPVMPSVTQIHPIARDPMPTAAWTVPEEGAVPLPPLPTAEAAAPFVAPQAKPARPQMDSEPGRRDTPTTMYVKDMHGPLGDAPAKGSRSEPMPTQALPSLLDEASGDALPTKQIDLPTGAGMRLEELQEDRETPTRAYQPGESATSAGKPILRTLQSPSFPDPSSANAALNGAPPGGTGPLPPGPPMMMTTMPLPRPPGFGVPPGQPGAPMPPGAPITFGAPPALPAPNGAQGGVLAAFKAAPPQTRLVVAIAAGGFLLMLVILIVVLIVR